MKKERQLVELIGDHSPSHEAPPRSKEEGTKEMLGKDGKELACQGHSGKAAQRK